MMDQNATEKCIDLGGDRKTALAERLEIIVRSDSGTKKKKDETADFALYLNYATANLQEITGIRCAKFCGFPSAVHDFAGQMAFMQCETTVFSSTLLAEQVFMFEGVERALYFGGTRSKKINLKTDTDLVFSDLKKVFSFLSDTQATDRLKTYLIISRTNYAHGFNGGNSDEFSLYYCTVTWMWTFLSAMILSKSGMPTGLIKRCLETSYADYKRPNAMLPGLLEGARYCRQSGKALQKQVANEIGN